MRHFLRRAPISNWKWFFRALSVAAAFLPMDSRHYEIKYFRDGFDYGGTRASEMLSTPWRLKLLPQRPFEFGNLTDSLSNVVLSQDDALSSEALRTDSKHGCNCLGRETIANSAAMVGSAVVNLTVNSREFLGLIKKRNMGSGTIIDPDGTILTSAHVVVDFIGVKASPKGKVEVTLKDGRTFEGKVLHADLHSDIAIVKIKAELPLPAAKFGSSSKLRPDDWVISLGCPFTLRNSVTVGIISCVDRKSSDLGLGGPKRDYLQTDCSINQGNSGGPLVNMDGEIVGVNSMKMSVADGLSFAVPIDSVSEVVEQFKNNRRVIEPLLGPRVVDVNEIILAQLKDGDPKFSNVDYDPPHIYSDLAGFKPGNVVISFDGTSVIIYIMGDKVGVQTKVVVKRTNGDIVNLVVTPEEADPDM